MVSKGRPQRTLRAGRKPVQGRSLSEVRSALLLAIESHQGNASNLAVRFPHARQLPQEVLADFARRVGVDPSTRGFMAKVNRVLQQAKQRPRM